MERGPLAKLSVDFEKHLAGSASDVQKGVPLLHADQADMFSYDEWNSQEGIAEIVASRADSGQDIARRPPCPHLCASVMVGHVGYTSRGTTGCRQAESRWRTAGGPSDGKLGVTIYRVQDPPMQRREAKR